MTKKDLMQAADFSRQKQSAHFAADVADIAEEYAIDEESSINPVISLADSLAINSTKGITLPASAYAAFLMQSFRDKTSFGEVMTKSRVDSEVGDLLSETLDEDCLDFSRQLSKQYTGANLVDLIVNFNFEHHGSDYSWFYCYSTERLITELAYSLLEIESDDIVADFGCGCGNFLTTVAQNSAALLYGVERDRTLAAFTKMRLSLLKDDAEIEWGDFLIGNSKRTFNKIFTQTLPKHGLSRWEVVERICGSLAPNGRAVMCLPETAADDCDGQDIRRRFIEDGMVQAIIGIDNMRLGQEHLDYSNDSCRDVLLVLGHNAGSVIKTTIYPTRWSGPANSAAKNDIQDIKKAVFEGLDDVAEEQMAEHGYSFNPFDYEKDPQQSQRLLKNPSDIDDLFNSAFADSAEHVPLEYFVESIERGVNISKDELTLIETEKATGYSYLRLSDIDEHGNISPDHLKNIRVVSPRFNRQCLKTGDIILSRNAPFKVAIAEVEEGQTIVASGNMYIIRLLPEINPYLMFAYFVSDQGKKELHSKATKRSVPSISKVNLRRLLIPYCSTEQQQEIEEAYRSYLERDEQAEEVYNEFREFATRFLAGRGD